MDSDALAARIEDRLGTPCPDPRATHHPPPRVADHEMIARIGSGSYGDVWLARSVTGQMRAVKVVWRQNFSSDRPYEREFRGILKFEPISRSHPGVVNVLHVGRGDEADCFYYVMELADAAKPERQEGPEAVADSVPSAVAVVPNTYSPRTLSSDLKSRGRLPVMEAVSLGVQLADALGHLHRHGLVHRDVKPSNVIFVRGHSKLADIGLVAGKDEAHSFVGTEGFIPPEGPGNERADLFSLGRLLYQAATGKDRCDFPELPADLDRWPMEERKALLELNEVLTRACAPEAAKRQANAAELALDLNLVLSGRSVRRTYGIERRLRRATWTSAIAGILVLVSVCAIWFQRRQAELSAARAQAESVLRQRAEVAEGRAREQLRESLLQQAMALTSSSEPDRRARALATLQEASGIRPGVDLRNAAAQALSTPQLRLLREWGNTEAAIQRPGPLLQRYARLHPDGGISVHLIKDDTETTRLAGTAKPVGWTQFSGDERWLTVTYGDDSLHVWNLEQKSSYILLANGALDHAFSSDNKLLAASCLSNHLHLFELSSGKERWTVPVSNEIYSLDFSPTEPLLAAMAPGQSRLDFYRTADGQIEKSVPVPEVGYRVKWSPDGRRLVSTHADFSVRVWKWPEINSAELVLRFHRSEPMFIAFDPSSRWLATAGWDNQIAFFDARDGRVLLNFPGAMILAAADRREFVWERSRRWFKAEFDPALALETLPLHDLGKSPRHLAFSADGNWLVTAGPDGMRLLEWRSRRVVLAATTDGSDAVGFSADSQQVYSLGSGGMHSWRLTSRSPASDARWETVPLSPALANTQSTRDIATFGPDHQHWVMGSVNPQTRRWSWLLGTLDGEASIFDDRNTSACDSPDLSRDGRWLAWGNWKADDAFVVDLQTNSAPLRFAMAGSTTARFSPDGCLLLICGMNEIRFVKTRSWSVVHSLPLHPPGSLIRHVAFTSDSRLCAVVLPPNEVQLIDPSGGTELIRLRLPAGHLLAKPIFSPDNQFLVVASTDHHLLIWNLAELRGKLRELALDW